MVKLEKGQKISLQKESPNLKRLLIGLGWDPAKTLLRAIDIDASVICIDDNGKKQDVVYYGHLKNSSRSIIHHGDNLTGVGDGDDEQIEIILDKVPEKISKLVIIINIYQALSRRQSLDKVKNCFVRAEDMDNHKQLLRYDIDESFQKGETGIFVADVYRYNGEWKFSARGQGAKVKDINEMVRMQCKH